jgi:hypothetical protein
VEIPYRDKLDGISFWSQLTGESQAEHRDVIYTWYIGNNQYTDEKAILRYAFNKEFKRYAPTHLYPEGRFFDLRTDPLERVGDSFELLRWGVRQYSGLDTDNLTPEQQEAYNALGEILRHHEYVPVDALEIKSKTTRMKIGETISLTCDVIPDNATRFRTIWESSDPEVASIDKFGEVTAHSQGEAWIRVFSWDDANPTSTNLDSTYFRSGVQDVITITVN